LLAHPDIRSKEDVVRVFDHEVQGGTAVKPLVGIANHGPSDATVLVPQDSQFTIDDLRFTKGDPESNRKSKIVNRKSIKGAALSNGINPHYGEYDPYAMAWANIDEAFRNAVAVGADPDQISILDNFCWGNPNLRDRLGSLVRCTQGCYDAAIAYQTPFISGKDSLNNEYTGADGEKHAIPGTLLISALGIVPDVNKTVTMDLKKEGNLLFVVGDTREELGGSHYFTIHNSQFIIHYSPVPQPITNPLARYRALHQAMQADLVQACHDCAEGGLAVALAEMCLAGGLGAMVTVTAVPIDGALTDVDILFSESQGRLVVEVKAENALQFRQLLQNIPHAQIGIVTGKDLLISGHTASTLVSLSIKELNEAWCGHLNGNQLLVNGNQLPVSNKKSPNLPISNLQSPPKVLILHANGTNRDHDAALACELAGGEPEIVHINQLLNGERRFRDYHMLVIPGGFSYGDDLGAGVLWGMDLRERFEGRLQQFVENGRPVLGICNGFQTLVKSGLLSVRSPQSAVLSRPVTLTYNESEQFECRWVYLEPNPNSACLFTQGLSEPIYCPVAHGEGRFSVQDESVAQLLQTENLIPLQYGGLTKNKKRKTENGKLESVDYPANPNGSMLDIAALCNPAGNVMGLMPHPENHIFPWQHPRTHRGEGGLDGLRLFANGIKNA